MLYLDHAASTNPFPDVIDALPEWGQLSANPSSVHADGRTARAALDRAKQTVSDIFECKTSELIFTSGATEAVHLALIGHYLALKKAGLNKGVIYTSPMVHSCVWSALLFLEENFAVKIKKLPITELGFLDLEQIGDTCFSEADMLISELGSSEIGLIQPVTKLGKKMIKWADENHSEKPALIVDAAAGVVTEVIGLHYLKCEFIALSGEKFGGLKGSGLLVKKAGIPLNSIIGGSHELGYRGGTENLVGTLAFARALELHSQKRASRRKTLVELHNYTRQFFETHFPEIDITSPVENFLPHVFHFILPDMLGPVFVAKADLAGLGVSAGSACSSGTTTHSEILVALGKTEAEAQRGVRISFGRDTTQKDLDQVFQIIKKILS